mmetsp:Transcript_145752/g.254318  ORF Transcript_145752/g.254318 Transcript_145752/m.254318 type:complete len:417 (+) Transcript_145752:51-1301(+)
MNRLLGSVALACCLPHFAFAVVATSDIPSFAAFISTHERTYAPGTDEYEKRRGLFEKRAEEAKLHNSREKRRWTAGTNHLWDWTDEELARLNGRRGGKGDAVQASSNRLAHVRPSLSLRQTGRGKQLPASAHWEHLNSSRTVRSQGGCGSCWAVAASTIMQAHSEIYVGTDWRTFAVQEFVNCVPNPQSCGGTGGCDGATVELALEYAMHNQMAKEHEVQYEARDMPCPSTGVPANTMASTASFLQPKVENRGHATTNFGMQGWVKLPENEYEPLLRAVYERGPVGVSVGASGWQSYASGIYDNCKKDIVVNHAVTLIGYGMEASSGDKFWHLLNSWGEDWGENGKMRLLRSDDDQSYCGKDRDPAAGTGCKGGPTEVEVCGMCGVLYDSALPHFEGSMMQVPQQSLLQSHGSLTK